MPRRYFVRQVLTAYTGAAVEPHGVAFLARDDAEAVVVQAVSACRTKRVDCVREVLRRLLGRSMWPPYVVRPMRSISGAHGIVVDRITVGKVLRDYLQEQGSYFGFNRTDNLHLMSVCAGGFIVANIDCC